jgi:hypothetical protein
MNTQEVVGCLSGPLRKGPDGQEIAVQGTLLKVVLVSTKYLSLVNSSVIKISLAFAGKCIAMAVVSAGMAAEQERVQLQFSFLTNYRVRHTCEPCWRNNCDICTRHCQGCGRNRNRGGKGGGFWNGCCRSFFASLPAGGSRAPILLSRGGCDRRVIAALSVPQGICSLHHGRGCLVVAST